MNCDTLIIIHADDSPAFVYTLKTCEMLPVESPSQILLASRESAEALENAALAFW